MSCTATRARPPAQHKNSLIDFEEAVRIVATEARPLASERIPLEIAAGRVLAEDLVASFDAPARPVAAMDGYAVRDDDLAQLPVSLPIAGSAFAGSGFGGALPPGRCVRIFTGAPAPEGTERVVMQEDVQRLGDSAHFFAPPSSRRHLRAPGSDFAVGDRMAPAGLVLTPQALVAAAAADRPELRVYRRPRVAVICCGDELLAPGRNAPRGGKIPESVSYGITALAEKWGALAVQRWRMPDDLTALSAIARKAVSLADLVVMIAGASVGERDFAKDAFAGADFQLLFEKVAIKPGKPVWFGRKGPALVLGLPGNPVSAMVTARLFLAPLLAGLGGRGVQEATAWQTVACGMPLNRSADRDQFLCAAMERGRAVPFAVQDSASQKILAATTHLIRRRPHDPAIAADEPVEILPL
jgi:molybdopterin molybdotransferase